MLSMNCSWVLPNLAVGPGPKLDHEFQELRALKVTAVLSLQTDKDRGKGGIEAEKAAAEKGGPDFLLMSRSGTTTASTCAPICPLAWPNSKDCCSKGTTCTCIARPE